MTEGRERLRAAPALAFALLAAGALLGAGCAASRAAIASGEDRPTPAVATETAPSAEAAAPPRADPWADPDRSQPPWSQTPVLPIEAGAVEREPEAGGTHLRIGTDRGVVHAWLPKGYRQRAAGTVVYLHGYYTDVDQAWRDHRLAEQFRKSGRNALFLAVEAPSWNGEEPFWPTLDELLAAVTGTAMLEIPRGPVVVAGHSGAFRGIVPWLVDPRIGEVLLLDGLYQGERDWAGWLDAAPRGQRRLVLVGLETAARSESWVPTRPGAVVLKRVPEPKRGLKASERSAPVLYMRSQHDHMALIEKGEVLPLLLRSGRLERHALGRP